uniref:Uncharacterized protein n=1 Tax=Romanomermis culicivorax TaxID=13658 RepID=A0A915HK34_ROMCU
MLKGFPKGVGAVPPLANVEVVAFCLTQKLCSFRPSLLMTFRWLLLVSFSPSRLYFNVLNASLRINSSNHYFPFHVDSNFEDGSRADRHCRYDAGVYRSYNQLQHADISRTYMRNSKEEIGEEKLKKN